MATKSKDASSLKTIFPNWEVKERVYHYKSKSTPVSFQLQSRNSDYNTLQWFDKNYGYARSLRYVTNQTTFFEDEQTGNAKLGSIVFIDGKLTVPAENTVLQQFLEIHPDNVANKGRKFFEFDADKAAREDLNKEMAGFEAVAVALDLPIEDLEAIGRVVFHNKVDELTSGELKRDVVFFAKRKPAEFMKIANNGNIKMRNLAQKAINLGIIKIKSDNVTVAWAANGKEITKLPFSPEPIETLASWLQTDEGLVLVEALALKMG